MEQKKLVIALGGNALGNTPEEQLNLVSHTARIIGSLAAEGHRVIVAHGNGPQVGMINAACDFAAARGAGTPSIPFPECGAMSQGYIGYHLAQALRNEFKKRGLDKEAVCLVTQVLVDKNDPAFNKPTKPVGSFITKEQAEKIASETGFVFVEDAGRGWRRVVASPLPRKIVELKTAEKLIESGAVVIIVGGGGIPVVENEDGFLEGIPAVIDKDRSSALLAREIGADMLLILTAVEKVYIHFNKPEQRALDTLTLAEARGYIAEGHFAPGSMLPKIEACIDFLEHSADGAQALISSLEKAQEALHGKTGTRLYIEQNISS
ncbi:carbamate kinase [Treponema sp. OMZ 840]|uniref:carbamate kinase n=1 Tax=Treponema sp. OMZ 840 TaxID=244313 RepID=UPI003D8FA614